MRTKIICTIGPNSDGEEKIRQLIENGMDIARLNFSHDTREKHGQRINLIRRLAKKLNKDVKIMCDLQGPKIRIADFKNSPIKISKDQKWVFTTSACKAIKRSEIQIDDPYLHADLKKNDIILIDDGQLEFIVEKVKQHKIHTRAIRDGLLFPRKGVNVPLTQTTTASLTKKDLKDLDFMLTKEPDFVAISFVQTASDVEQVKKLLGQSNIKIISKIERANAFNNINQIISASDAVLVARGDLGVEMPIEELPVIQKKIIKSCNYVGKPVIAATQMLSSMLNQPYPSRAEVTDISNAVFDGADAVMLSNETTVGKYPIEALQIMVKIVKATEDYIYHRQNNL